MALNQRPQRTLHGTSRKVNWILKIFSLWKKKHCVTFAFVLKDFLNILVKNIYQAMKEIIL